jgi:hypothetical protein
VALLRFVPSYIVYAQSYTYKCSVVRMYIKDDNELQLACVRTPLGSGNNRLIFQVLAVQWYACSCLDSNYVSAFILLF